LKEVVVGEEEVLGQVEEVYIQSASIESEMKAMPMVPTPNLHQVMANHKEENLKTRV